MVLASNDARVVPGTASSSPGEVEPAPDAMELGLGECHSAPPCPSDQRRSRRLLADLLRPEDRAFQAYGLSDAQLV